MICRGYRLERVETPLYHNRGAELYAEPDLGFCEGLHCIMYCDEDYTLCVRKRRICVYVYWVSVMGQNVVGKKARERGVMSPYRIASRTGRQERQITAERGDTYSRDS
jgi:hypothetical protein